MKTPPLSTILGIILLPLGFFLLKDPTILTVRFLSLAIITWGTHWLLFPVVNHLAKTYGPGRKLDTKYIKEGLLIIAKGMMILVVTEIAGGLKVFTSFQYGMIIVALLAGVGLYLWSFYSNTKDPGLAKSNEFGMQIFGSSMCIVALLFLVALTFGVLT